MEQIHNSDSERQVRQQSEKHQILFLHTVNASMSVETNSLLRNQEEGDGGKITNYDKINNIRSGNCADLSCSSFILNGEPINGSAFGDGTIGVIVGSGFIKSIHSTDGGTNTEKSKLSLTETKKTEKPTLEVGPTELKMLTDRKNNAGYNEVIIGNLEPSAIYVNLDHYVRNTNNDTSDKLMRVIEAIQVTEKANLEAKKYGAKPIPLVIIMEGKVFQLNDIKNHEDINIISTFQSRDKNYNWSKHKESPEEFQRKNQELEKLWRETNKKIRPINLNTLIHQTFQLTEVNLQQLLDTPNIISNDSKRKLGRSKSIQDMFRTYISYINDRIDNLDYDEKEPIPLSENYLKGKTAGELSKGIVKIIIPKLVEATIDTNPIEPQKINSDTIFPTLQIPVETLIWHIHTQNKTYGPYSDNQMVAFSKTKQLAPHTLVWKEGIETWTKAETVPELAKIFTPNLPEGPFNLHNAREKLNTTSTNSNTNTNLKPT